MKPPLDHKVKRPFEWVSAASHSDPSHFAERMDGYRAKVAAESARERSEKVRTIKRR